MIIDGGDLDGHWAPFDEAGDLIYRFNRAREAYRTSGYESQTDEFDDYYRIYHRMRDLIQLGLSTERQST